MFAANSIRWKSAKKERKVETSRSEWMCLYVDLVPARHAWQFDLRGGEGKIKPRQVNAQAVLHTLEGEYMGNGADVKCTRTYPPCGRRIVKVLPCPTVEVTPICPPFASTMARVNASPKPLPRTRFVRADLVR